MVGFTVEEWRGVSPQILSLWPVLLLSVPPLAPRGAAGFLGVRSALCVAGRVGLAGSSVSLLLVTWDADRCLAICSFPSLDHRRGPALPLGALLPEQHPAGQHQVSLWGPHSTERERGCLFAGWLAAVTPAPPHHHQHTQYCIRGLVALIPGASLLGQRRKTQGLLQWGFSKPWGLG